MGAEALPDPGKPLREALRGQRLPAALVDLDAMDRNIDRITSLAREAGRTLRVASKSVRHVGLLRRILERGGPTIQGVMCYSPEELDFLADQGFDDLLLAYPTVRPAALDLLARRAAAGRTLHLIVDCAEHVEAAARAARAVGVTLNLVIELDVSYRPGAGLHLGARRSPLRRAEDVLALALQIRSTPGVRVSGLMAYEGHIAGLTDENPFSPRMNPLRKLFKRLSGPKVMAERGRTVALLQREGVHLGLVNGGGTGSLRSTAQDERVTELCAGSGFLCSHLFSWYEGNELEPAAFFALECVRRPDPEVITCFGGGYVASGEPGWDRVPLPCSPPGLSYLPMEAAGEVQTPLRLPPGCELSLGESVLFRHAKAGELAERFDEYLLLRGGQIVGREKTYRGQGQCFG